MQRLTCTVLALAALAGCQVDDEEMAESIEQAATCPSWGCGDWLNGIRQRAWNDAAGGALFAGALSRIGAGDSGGPYSLCERFLSGGTCVVREAWMRWATNDYSSDTSWGSVRTLRTEVFRKMLALAGTPGQRYYDYLEATGGYQDLGVLGSWALTPQALSSRFTYRDQEVMTAGLLLLLNANGVHVEVGLGTVDVTPPPEQSPDGLRYEEAAAFGNIFRGPGFTGISGGYHAPDPSRHARFSAMALTSSHDVWLRSDGRCDYSAHAIGDYRRVATRCRDHLGRTWQSPVVARLRVWSSSWTIPGPGKVNDPLGGTKITY